MKELYNLLWVYPMLAKKETVNVSRVCDIQKNNTQALVSVIGVDAVILYPALLTPAVVVGKSDLEILLLIKDGQDLDESNVNQQLKISPGLDAMKPYFKDPLFKEAYFLKIKIEDLQFNDNVIKGKGFSGILDKRAIEFYKKENYNQLKLVAINTEELFGVTRGGKQENLNKPNQKSDKKEIIPGEKQDILLWKRLKKINGESLPLHSFQIKASKDDKNPDVDLTDVNLKSPIQSYHPVCYYDSMDASNLFVLGDIHLSSRHKVLMKSTARVIENEDYKDKDLLSPEIGKLVNSSSMNFINLLNNGGGDSDVDMVWIVGDFVDYIKNIYPIPNISNPSQVWDAVALDDSYETRYRDHVDYISVYSIVVDFYKQHQKPIFGVKGNHDSYYYPFGISPRIGGIKKANEGIPADHNLTFYEALLAFGKTYGEIKKKLNFNEDKFEWFALMLSPLSDFSVELPKQVMVGFGWGDKEDLVGSLDDTKQGLGGHLPRADASISAKQLKLVDDAVKKNKKVVLASHFTFVSYKEEIAENSGKAGTTIVPGSYGICDMGTFELNRDEVLGAHLGKRRDIQCVISGHSHRRAAYEIIKAEKTTETVSYAEAGIVDSYDKYKLSTKMHVFDKYNKFNPLILVTDSAGPIPRRNILGEFKEHGSDPAAGTKVLFDKGLGDINGMERVPSECERAQPRIAVAIDYYDIMEQSIINDFSSAIIDEKKIVLDSKDSLLFTINVNKDIAKWGLSIDRILLSLFDRDWKVIQFTRTNRDGVWSLSGADSKALFALSRDNKSDKAKKYLSIYFNNSGVRHLSSYSFEDSWNIEVDVMLDTLITQGSEMVLTQPEYFVIKRSIKYREKPDFDSRRSLYNE